MLSCHEHALPTQKCSNESYFICKSKILAQQVSIRPSKADALVLHVSAYMPQRILLKIFKKIM